MKWCSGCSTSKPHEAFNKCRTAADGLQGKCRTCQAAWRKANAEAIKAKDAAYYATNKEQIQAKQAAAYAANPEPAKARAAAWEAANPERVKKRRSAYHAANAEIINARSAAWRAANPERVAANCATRRARKRNAEVVELIIPKVVYERDGWKCHICKKKMNKRLKWPYPLSPSVDHLIPLSKGGDHSYANVAAAHLHCNVSRSTGGEAQLRLLG